MEDERLKNLRSARTNRLNNRKYIFNNFLKRFHRNQRTSCHDSASNIMWTLKYSRKSSYERVKDKNR